MVTHDIELANKISDRVIRLLDGRIIEDYNPVRHEYP
jgi:ABC-type polar amino acid transport system ATPase subunit